MTARLFKIKKLGEDGELHNFDFNIPANESEMGIGGKELMNSELTFKIRCEIKVRKNGMPIAIKNKEGRWNKCDLFKINGLNPKLETKLPGNYYIQYPIPLAQSPEPSPDPPSMKLGELCNKARAMGVTREALTDALDIEDPERRKDAVIALINGKSGGGKRKKSKRRKTKKRRSKKRRSKRRS